MAIEKDSQVTGVSNEEIGMDHLQNKCTGHWCEAIFEDAQEKDSLTQTTKMERRSITTVSQIVGKRMKSTDNQWSWNGHTKAELQSWDTQMRTRTRWQCRRSPTNSVTWADTFGKAENQANRRTNKQLIAGRNLRQEEQAHPSSSSSSQWDGWWMSSWWDKSWPWKE